MTAVVEDFAVEWHAEAIDVSLACMNVDKIDVRLLQRFLARHA
jgi:hypothetical protein